MKRNVVIIGAGPAGLTAAFKLTSEYSDQFNVFVIEKESTTGGLSKTVSDGVMSLDIGGHRFFTDNAAISTIWENLIPAEEFLSISRSSKILYDQHFYTYPISLSRETLCQLGLSRGLRILSGYVLSKKKYFEVNNLEQFYIHQFGEPLYRMFFKDYTEKVWGRRASEISPDWGKQRTEGLSLGRILTEKYTQTKYTPSRTSASTYRYPTEGAGMLWNRMAKDIVAHGGTIICKEKVSKILFKDKKAYAVQCDSGRNYPADYILSSMPMIDLAHAVCNIPPDIKAIAEDLKYRDFIIVGMSLKKASLVGHRLMDHKEQLIKDQWLYIQDPKVKLARIQLFENWSHWFSIGPDTVLLGLEYFCNKDSKEWVENDAFWAQTSLSELKLLDIIGKDTYFHRCFVYRAEKAYPCYWDGYDKLNDLKAYFNNFQNLICIGRNGQHFYCNMDQAMESGLHAAVKIVNDLS